MRTTKRLVQAGAISATAIGAVAMVAPDSAPGRAVRRLAARLQRDVRYVAASAPGLIYRLSGRRPDPDVGDDVIADRVRSALGPLERRLDLPHVHVMVEDKVAILHGDVDTYGDIARIELAVMQVSGVRGVVSHLHHGLLAGDTRPSEGRAARKPSAALEKLLESARQAGATDPVPAVHAVLCAFGERIPDDELAHVLNHLPADVRALMSGPARHGEPSPRLRTVPQLVGAVVAEGGIAPPVAERVTRAVVTALRKLVPDEANDVAAVLPAELRDLWNGALVTHGE